MLSIIANEPAEQDARLARRQKIVPREIVSMQKNSRSCLRSCKVYFWFEPITRSELLDND